MAFIPFEKTKFFHYRSKNGSEDLLNNSKGGFPFVRIRSRERATSSLGMRGSF